MSGMSYPI